ncbi:MAG: NAD(P)-dependent alcohol dehydrogenase [Asgard group archaeon]|nr:NAD(P)-dependent alcohol dehydrogenase [Asgard group archaeon]
MKAVVYKKYGSTKVLKLKDVEKPSPKDNEVLVRIHAASANAADLDQLKGVFLIRLQGLFRPKYEILGSDFAGVVEVVGKDVRQFQPGDEVLGDLTQCGFGAFAEYVCVPEKILTLKPTSISFEEAASIPSAGVLAVQGLRDYGQIKPGLKVLINGAGGSLGPFAVQLAKYFETEVTAVDSRGKFDMLRSIGADNVVDYSQEDYTKKGISYDLILDNVAKRSISDYIRALNPNGNFVMVGGSTSTMIKIFLRGRKILKREDKKLSVLIGKPNRREDVDFLLNLIESRKVIPVIDSTYPLSEVAEAFKHLEAGHPNGKIIIRVED